MWSTPVVLQITASILILPDFKITQAKTYYFNLNKTSNEYVIKSRLNPNISAYDPARLHLGELRNNITRRIIKNETYTHPFLDSEWDYDWKNVTRTKLPTFIYKFYDTFSRNLTGPVRILFNAEPQNSTLLKFNVSELNVNENISEVELHFYHTVDKNLLQKSLILRLYQVENDHVNASSLINPDAYKLLNVIYAYQADNGWQVFKITNGIYKWLQKRKDPILFITISKPNEDQFNFFRDTKREDFRTFLFLRFESRKLGSVDDSKSEDNHYQTCRKHELYIDFEKLNWMKFIVSPSGYHAFNCYGTCNRHENLTNHRKVTSFIPDMARKPPCCAPVQYADLPIIFYDKNGNVAIKLYEGMIITKCGCR